ncbi:MAG: hypothetical protein ACXVCP_02695 [Bdellovibrio sp.]
MAEEKKGLGRITKIFLVTVLVLVFIRALLPSVILLGTNYFLSHELEDYRGHINNIDLAIYRGAYSIDGLRIWKRNRSLTDAVFSVENISFNLKWKALFNRKILGSVIVDKAAVYLTDTKKEAKKQITTEQLLRKWTRKLLPIKLEQVTVLNSSILYKNIDYNPPLEFDVDEINVFADNLTNFNDVKKELPSSIDAKARIQKSAILKTDLKANFTKLRPELHGKIQMDKFDLKKVNSILLANDLMTFNKGYFSLYGELAVKNNHIKGYIKSFFEDLDIISPTEKFGSAKRALLELGAAFGNLVLRNKQTKTVATKIDFDGEVEGPDVKTGEAFWTSINNAFVKALKKGIENSISIKSVSSEVPDEKGL